MYWLDYLKKELFKITNEASIEFWPKPNGKEPYFNYRYEHVTQVDKEAKKLLNKIDADHNIVNASVWIHDMFQPVFKGDEPHGEKAAIWAEQNLGQLGFPRNRIPDVSYAVKVHSSKPGSINKNKIEACILWDADKLSKLSPYNLLINLFTKVFAQDCIENIDQSIYEKGQITISELIINEIAPLLVNDPIDTFYFNISNEIANNWRNISNNFYQLLIDNIN